MWNYRRDLYVPWTDRKLHQWVTCGRLRPELSLKAQMNKLRLLWTYHEKPKFTGEDNIARKTGKC